MSSERRELTDQIAIEPDSFEIKIIIYPHTVPKGAEARFLKALEDRARAEFELLSERIPPAIRAERRVCVRRDG